jgi:ABC-type uncharacterized transport system ATPase subunit
LSFLSMQKICKSFGAVHANRDVDLEVGRGEIHALLGENGAGKTTLMNILYGLYRADSGTVSIHGRPVGIASPREAIALSIGMVHQHFMLVPTLSVSENITLGIREKGYPFTDRKEINRKIEKLSDEYGLDVDPRAMVEQLSVGVLQRVEIIKLLYHQAELLILDEPTAVLTPQETKNLFAVLERLKKDGKSMVIITHRIAEARSIADRVTVMRDGVRVGCAGIRDVDDAGLSELMIGRQLDAVSRGDRLPLKPHRRQQPLVSLEAVTLHGESRDILSDISFEIQRGEILGLAGVDGNGQKELAEVIAGIRSPDRGNIFFKGRDVTASGVRKRKKDGIAYIPDDRHHDGLILDMDLTGNLALNSHDSSPFSRFHFLRDKVMRRHAEEAIAAYRIKTPGAGTLVRQLSGGNQQKIILARELEGVPDLIVASQPTRGLDIGAEEFINKLLLEQRERGAAVLLISASLEQLLALSDRVAVIFDGRIICSLQNDDNIDLAEIGLHMAGVSSGRAGAAA